TCLLALRIIHRLVLVLLLVSKLLISLITHSLFRFMSIIITHLMVVLMNKGVYYRLVKSLSHTRIMISKCNKREPLAARQRVLFYYNLIIVGLLLPHTTLEILLSH